jgi:hypothetical protein
MAEKMPIEGQLISGIMVAKDYQYSIMAATDLDEFGGQSTSTIRQRMSVPCRATLSLVRYQLEQMYGTIEVAIMNNDNKNKNSNKEPTDEHQSKDADHQRVKYTVSGIIWDYYYYYFMITINTFINIITAYH